MAQRRKQSPASGRGSGGSKGGSRQRSGPSRPNSGGPGGSRGRSSGGRASSGRRQSVAAARRSKGDRTQLIIGAVAIAVIIAIIAVGIWMYQKNTAVQGSGYGVSTKSTASVSDKGIITVSNGDPSLVLDIYEDGICPYCADFEHQYGQQVAKAIDQGNLTARYHMVDFLNGNSASGTYSTRAYAALIAVATVDGGDPGVFMAFHTALYAKGTQPEENSGKDLSNDQLADVADKAGASKKALQQIKDGTYVQDAKKDAQANLQSLKDLAASAGSSSYGTPTVAKDGKPLDTNDVNWLTNLLPASAKDSGQVKDSAGASGKSVPTSGR